MTPLQPLTSLRVVLAWIVAASVLVGSGAAWVHWRQGEYLSEFVSCCGPGESEWHELIQPPFAVDDALVGLAWGGAGFAVLVVLNVAWRAWAVYQRERREN